MTSLVLALVASSVQAHNTSPPTDIFRFDGFRVEGAASTVLDNKMLTAYVRLQGHLPKSGVWSYEHLKLSKLDGKPIVSGQEMFQVEDATPYTDCQIGYAPLTGIVAPRQVLIQGDLIHYRDVEETATFPPVKMTLIDRSTIEEGVNRGWSLPIGCSLTATTKRGLTLHFTDHVIGSYFHHRKYADTAWIPIYVDPATLNKGLQKDLVAGKEASVRRVDAYVDGYSMVQFTRSGKNPLQGMFILDQPEPISELRLTLHVIRRIVDRRYSFSFVAPVQKDKVFQVDGAIVWPSR